MSMASVFVMNMTPGRLGEKPPHVLWEPKVFADLKIGVVF
jgi:hypothetical protein